MRGYLPLASIAWAIVAAAGYASSASAQSLFRVVPLGQPVEIGRPGPPIGTPVPLGRPYEIGRPGPPVGTPVPLGRPYEIGRPGPPVGTPVPLGRPYEIGRPGPPVGAPTPLGNPYVIGRPGSPVGTPTPLGSPYVIGRPGAIGSPGQIGTPSTVGRSTQIGTPTEPEGTNPYAKALSGGSETSASVGADQNNPYTKALSARTSGASGATWSSSSGNTTTEKQASSDLNGQDAVANPIGVPIDSTTAMAALPYALMSRAAYGEDTTPPVGYRKIADWKTVLRNSGVSETTISDYDKGGFSAQVFSNPSKNEIVIAYRGTEPLSTVDWATDYLAKAGGPKDMPIQYVAAQALANAEQKNYPDTVISLTGHSLGGGLASYAAEAVAPDRLGTVYTFNGARNQYSLNTKNGKQVNIAVPGDPVGDPAVASFAGEGSFPGQNYSVYSSSVAVTGQDCTLLQCGVHDIDGIIGGLSDAARQGLLDRRR